MNKLGQVTLFVIIAIIIVASTSAYFIFRKSSSSVLGEKGSTSGFESVKGFVDSCIDNVTEDVVYMVGVGGGKYYPPVDSDEYGYTYHYNSGNSTFPTKTEIEDEISINTIAKLIYCVNDFENFKDINITSGTIEVNTNILEDEVEIEVIYPLILSKGNVTVTLRDFDKRIIPVKFGKMYSVMGELINENYYSTEGICISCLVDLAYENGLNFETYNYNGNDLFVLSDLEEVNKDKPFRFIFVNRGIENEI
ncbi:hypothetical protein GW932_04100 [archaeon]|nr:hypothetical protein [archaeon]